MMYTSSRRPWQMRSGAKFEKDPNKAGVYNITADSKGLRQTLTIGMSKEMAQKQVVFSFGSRR